MPVIIYTSKFCDGCLEVTTMFLDIQINNYLNCKTYKTYFNKIKHFFFFVIMSLVFIENKNCCKHYTWHIECDISKIFHVDAVLSALLQLIIT